MKNKEKMIIAWRKWAIKNNVMSDDGTIWEPMGLYDVLFDAFRAGWKGKGKKR